MAVAGDVVVRLAADVAELKQGMAEATAKLDEFGQQASAAGQKLDSFTSGVGNTLKSLGIAAAFTAAINEIKALADASQKAAVDAAKLAQQYGITAEQVQALQVVSERTGRSMDDLAKAGKQNVEWLRNVTEEAKRGGLVISEEYTSKLRELEQQSEETERRLRVLFAPAVAGVRSWIADSLEVMAANLKAIAANEGILDKIIALITLGQSGGGAAGARVNMMQSLERAADTLGSDIKALETQLGSGRRLTPQETETYTNRLTEARDKLAANRRDYNRQLAQQTEGSPVIQEAPITVKATRIPSGGGGRTDEENMEQQIRRYQALGAAATKAYGDIRDKHFTLVEDVQRELRVQQQIEQIAARLGARYASASDEQKKMLHDAVEGWERAKEASAEYVRQVQAAEDVNARFGGGTAARDRARRELERARAGGADPRALQRAAKAQEEQLNASERAASRYDDSIESLGNGIADAADKFARANDMFSQGGQIFGAFTSAMSQGLDVLAGKSNKTFGDIAADFAMMLAKMALQAAASQVFKFAFGSLFPGGGGDIMNVMPAGGGYSAGIDPTSGLGWLTPRAGGGDVYPGNRYRVGEYGPETFVPTAVGRIEPMGNKSDGGTVNVNVDMSRQQGTADPTHAMELGRRVKAAVMDVIQNEKRPGGTLYR